MTDVIEDSNGTKIAFRYDPPGPLQIGRCVEILATKGYGVHFGRGPDFMGLKGGDGLVVAVVETPSGKKFAIGHGEPFDKLPLQDLLAKSLTHFIFDHVDLEA